MSSLSSSGLSSRTRSSTGSKPQGTSWNTYSNVVNKCMSLSRSERQSIEISRLPTSTESALTQHQPNETWHFYGRNLCMERLRQEGKKSWTDLLNTVNPRLCKNIRIGDASILILRLFEFCVVLKTFHGCRWLPWSGLKLNIISYMFQKDFSGCKLFGSSTGSSLRYIPCRDFQIAFCFLKRYLTIIVAQRLSKTNYS